MQTITIKEYLIKKGIEFTERNGELITKCLFNNCDADSTGSEAHLYFAAETGLYDCKKCGEKGNLVTLAKHLGDGLDAIALNPRKATRTKSDIKFDTNGVDISHLLLPAAARQYLNARGITNAVIDEYKLGCGKFYGKGWITIPIKDGNDNYVFFKLRQDPGVGNNKITYPRGAEAQIYGWEILDQENEKIIICEGELDRLALISKGVPAITSTHGAMTFKEEWVDLVTRKTKKIYVCYDNDETGRKGAERVLKMLRKGSATETYLVTLPPEVGEAGDVTDYLTKLNGTVDDLFEKYAKPYPEPIDVSKFKPLSSKDLINILELTIKRDDQNKLATLLCVLSAFTENSQFNISFNAPSSTGKSYIPLEISDLVPKEDVIKLGNCSPMAFYHEQGVYNKETNTTTVDLSRKIIIFLDQPHNELLIRLRSLLSHDEKEIQSKTADKTQRGGNKTKTSVIKGFPSVIFCSAALRVDEQEGTRFLLLSPETNQEKIKEAVQERIKRETDGGSYKLRLESNPDRMLLKQRLEAIRDEHIDEIKIINPEMVEKAFLEKRTILKPRHARDIGRLINLVKAFALLNLWFRERDGNTIIANDEDITEALYVWEKISESQEYNLPPYVYNLFKDIIVPAFDEKNIFGIATEAKGLNRREILDKHFKVYGRTLDGTKLRQEILPILEIAGLIQQIPNLDDKREKLVYPILPQIAPDTNNSEQHRGVKPDELQNQNNIVS